MKKRQNENLQNDNEDLRNDNGNLRFIQPEWNENEFRPPPCPRPAEASRWLKGEMAVQRRFLGLECKIQRESYSEFFTLFMSIPNPIRLSVVQPG